jgi:multicomponent Na+:H+ antiporter subunit F
MTDLLALAALVLLIGLALGLIRVLRGPTRADRMMAAQLIGTAGIGALLLLAPVLAVPALVDVALVLALLAAVTVAALTAREAHVDNGHD